MDKQCCNSFNRLELMVGEKTLSAISSSRVAVFGVGGVGSWCAESLVRSGVRRMTLVDADKVCETNVNRQLMATTKTIGRVKVEALAERLRDINPDAELELRAQIYDASTADSFDLAAFDYVIDAIDSLESKALLIRRALAVPTATLFSSMGAAVKMDPFQVRQSEFRKVEGDGLARALRRKFRLTGGIPERRFICVWSPEHRENIASAAAVEDGAAQFGKVRVNGTVAHTTAIFGFALAGLVISDIERRSQSIGA